MNKIDFKQLVSGKKSSRKGFTLIELLISIVLFTIFLGLVSQSYLSIVRTQRQANEVRKMYSEVRIFMDSLAEEIRLSAIDYDCYWGNLGLENEPLCASDATGTIVNGHSSVLSLVKKSGGEKTTYKIVEEDDRIIIKVKKWYLDNGIWAVVPGYQGFRNVFSEKLTINYVDFAIFPDVNPYSKLNYLDNAVQFQPKVTFFLSVKNAEGTNAKFDYQFQTTISSRVYSREI